LSVVILNLIFFDTTEIVIKQLQLCTITSNFLTFLLLTGPTYIFGALSLVLLRGGF
jgi:hypothetical protein